MKLKNKVDLVIPVHGKAHFLLDTIRSINENGLINEIIYVLDRADVSVRNLIQENTFIQYRIVDSLKPGIANALNLGLRESESEFIARIDSDDMMAINRISKQLEILEEHQEIGLVASNYYRINDAGKIISITKTEFNQDDLKKLLIFKNIIAHPTVMFRKSTVLRVGGYRSEFEGAEDYDLWLRLLNITEIKIIEDPLVYYRLSEFQYTNRLKYMRFELDKAVRISFLLNSNNQSANYNELNGPPSLEALSELNTEFSKQLRKISMIDYKILKSASFISLISISKNKKSPVNIWRALKAILVLFPKFRYMILSFKVMKIK